MMMMMRRMINGGDTFAEHLSAFLLFVTLRTSSRLTSAFELCPLRGTVSPATVAAHPSHELRTPGAQVTRFEAAAVHAGTVCLAAVQARRAAI